MPTQDINTTTFTARLTTDPELTSTRNGTSVCTLRVAIGRGKGKDGSDRGAAFYSVQCWGVTAENCAKYLAKGRRVAVSGRLDHSEWRTPEDQRRDRNYVVAEQVQFLDFAPADEPADEPVPEEVAA